jgi:hypothetical protein
VRGEKSDLGQVHIQARMSASNPLPGASVMVIMLDESSHRDQALVEGYTYREKCSGGVFRMLFTLQWF